MPTIITEYPALRHESITVSSTAIGFTAAYISADGQYENKQCLEVFCTLETDSIRFTLDGTTPTSAVGHRLEPGQSLTLKNASDIQNFRAIRITTDATLKVTYRY